METVFGALSARKRNDSLSLGHGHYGTASSIPPDFSTLPTRVFCEWGSGFGTATRLAALLGYEAYGIERDAELVWRARAIARRLRIPATFLCTSLFPAGSDVDGNSAAVVRPAVGRDPAAEARRSLRYESMPRTIAEIGVFFAYPWPEERARIQALFEAVAAAGALLVMYHMDTHICVVRKVAG